MKKKLSMILASILLLGIISGCTAEVTNVTVNADGSGKVAAFIGYTEQGLKDIVDYMDEDSSKIDLSTLDSYKYNGITYYGTSYTNEFLKPQDMSFDFETEDDGITSLVALDYGDVELYMNTDGSIGLDIIISEEDLEVTTTGMSPSEQEMYNMMLQYKDSMALILEFNMPDKVKKVSGGSTGIKIDGNKLTINYGDIIFNNAKDTSYRFTTGMEVPLLKKVFTDVPETAWYATAVYTMANKGIVGGYGDGMFGPADTLTVAQFSQILSNTLGLVTGANNEGYWAGKAVQSCILAGYIENRGNIVSQNYDIPITREEAIVAVTKASKNAVVKSFRSIDIPDVNNIRADYVEYIVEAYNKGITAGVDSNNTFLPKNNLTRAEICQLMYNLEY